MHFVRGTFSRLIREQEELVLEGWASLSGGILCSGAAIKIREKLASNLTIVLFLLDVGVGIGLY